MSINDIVNVTITRDIPSISRASFGIINNLGENKAFIPLIKFYTSTTEVGVDFNSSDPEFISASDIFSQQPSVVKIAISRRKTGDTTVITVATVIADADYVITINGTAFTFNSGGTPTNITIAAGIVALITGVDVSPTDNVDGTFDLDPDTPGDQYSVKTDTKMTKAFTASQGIVADLTDIINEDDSWYGLTLADRSVQADVESVMDFMETQAKIFEVSSNDAVIADSTKSSDTTSIAFHAQSNSLARSGVWYDPLTSSQFMDSAILGKVLPLDPGTWTAKFKTLAGVQVSNLTTTQKTNISAKNANFYQTVGGTNITCNGIHGEGNAAFMDIIVLVDFMSARIQEGVFGMLTTQDKVPYTDEGITAVEAEIVKVLSALQVSGAVVSFTTSVPLAADVSTGDKSARILNNVKFTAEISGAIHSITINGTVTV